MVQKLKHLVILLIIAYFPHLIGANDDSPRANPTVSSRALDPSFKYLIFPEGSNVQPQSVFTMGVTAGLAYELPYKRIVPFRRAAEIYYHGRRNRRDLYRKLEKMLDTQKKNGRDCILWALCQAGKRNRKQRFRKQMKMSFLEEIFHAIFTYPNDKETFNADTQKLHDEMVLDAEYDFAYNAQVDCHKLFKPCPKLFF